MSEQDYSHAVEIDEVSCKLKVYRVFSNGVKQLYTEAELPRLASNPNNSAYENFARMLGENILIDSPLARRIIGL